MNRWDEFTDVWRKYKELSLAAGGAAALPFVGLFAGIEPPSFNGLSLITGVVQILAVIVVFFFMRSRPKSDVGRLIKISTMLFAIGSIWYLLLFDFFTFTIPGGAGRGVKGFVCIGIADALTIEERSECPFISATHFAEGGYKPRLFWESWSISFTEFSLTLLWSINFAFLAIIVSSFVVYLSRRSSRERPRKVMEGRP
jgi:hypothetical protein